MAEETKNQLVQLRSQVLGELVTYSDQLAQSEEVSYDALLAIAHMSENAALLPKVLDKIHAIADEKERANALLDLLSEVDLQMTYTQEPVSEPAPSIPEHIDGNDVQYHGDQQ